MNTMNNNKEKQNDWKEREIGALWKKSKGGSSYCTGYIVSDELGNKVRQRVIMFSNKTKSNENSPDFILYISKDQNTENEPKAVAAKPKPVKKEVKQPEPSNDDEIPEITD
jgi:hypothetical protein